MEEKIRFPEDVRLLYSARASEIKKAWLDTMARLIEIKETIIRVKKKKEEGKTYDILKDDMDKINSLRFALIQISLIFDEFLAVANHYSLSKQLKEKIEKVKQKIIELDVYNVDSFYAANADVMDVLTQYEIELLTK